MGFITGFFSGFALTTSALYITIQVHKSTRLDQRNAIRDQVRALNWLSSSTGAYDRRLMPADDGAVSKISEPTVKDVLKHRWNKEVEKLARKAHESRWEDVRQTAAEGWKAAMKLLKKD